MQIHYIQPYAVDKNIGKAYNEEVVNLCYTYPDEWVCITDQDTMFLLPDTKAIIHDTVMAHKDKYDLLTCYTNRLNYGYQLHGGQRSEDSDMNNHINIAKGRLVAHGTDVKPYPHIVAGMFMLFPLKVIRHIRFIENSPYFDEKFTADVRAAGGRVGIMEGVYIFHLYRWGQTNPGEHFKHLLP